jgi:hypothetical protein
VTIIAARMIDDDDIRLHIDRSLSRVFIPGYRRSLSAQERKRISATIVDDLKGSGWSFSRRRSPSGEGLRDPDET